MAILRRTCSLSVYPRWRGEHRRTEKPFSANVGLSPLARGTH
ncbi:hypothetical protein A676_02688 [Salmonella enterica subsp. enterica serovar Enteritidis str. 2010K-0262]|uniref:Uncharacterized protein n=1 Tax=Salmonella enteritidis (strain 2009K0958) TaxID=1192586 RepID=A0A656IGP0_SALE2|nr:hypothetical protein A673_02718 [Salmonella enterica subsp. enterica serovar Enteritidis str. 2009K0958]EPI71016.1 hypothetical protein A672_02834 [Salmonella enterica subsp. enterica serovar Enteritidis str. 08-1080]EPI82114.1 hypothetical protein A676_02688 [Salmonella enterica subsp. enterica serovar Enteritidis str. 2010K-0262]EPI87535.1 hypothetical protein A674_01921 [Salmonella enterica subsp. enterica serovar Enteritidis str. 2009K1651]